jgi:hypothetical protein
MPTMGGCQHDGQSVAVLLPVWIPHAVRLCRDSQLQNEGKLKVEEILAVQAF